MLPLTVTTCFAGNKAEEIHWDDLIPQKYRTEDPLAHLAQEEMDKVEWIIYLRQNLPQQITSKEQEFYDEMIEALPKLKKRGIDVDEIIAIRKVRENAINSELDGKYVRLAGYLLPLDLTGKEVGEFLLVPYVGACIHVPPPPPNQIVYATTNKPIKYEVNDLFKPIWAVGKFSAKSISTELYLGDGAADINVGYVMQVEAIEKYKK